MDRRWRDRYVGAAGVEEDAGVPAGGVAGGGGQEEGEGVDQEHGCCYGGLLASLSSSPPTIFLILSGVVFILVDFEFSRVVHGAVLQARTCICTRSGTLVINRSMVAVCSHQLTNIC
jgi:hypothetical protein